MNISINKKSIFSLASLLPVLCILFLSTCKNKNSSPENVEEHKEAPGSNELNLSKDQFETIKVQLGRIEKRNLTNILKATGFLKVPPQNKASITSAIGGMVQSIYVQEGDYVKKGELILTLINPDFIKMQEDYLSAKTHLEFSNSEYIRQKELSEKNVSSQKVFQQVQSDYYSLKAKVNSLRKQLAVAGLNADNLTDENLTSEIQIRSPIDGSISHIDINIGTNIQPAMAMMNVVDNSQLHLDLFVYEQDLSKVKVGQTVSFTLTNLPGKSYTANIFSVGNAFENETKSITVHASIPGEKSGLIEGMNVTASINIGDNAIPAIETSAIASFAGQDYIFIQTEGHKPTLHNHEESESKVEKEELGDVYVFKKIQIKRGVTNGIYTGIAPLEDVPESAKVVIEGAYYLMAMLTNEGEEE